MHIHVFAPENGEIDQDQGNQEGRPAEQTGKQVVDPPAKNTDLAGTLMENIASAQKQRGDEQQIGDHLVHHFFGARCFDLHAARRFTATAALTLLPLRRLPGGFFDRFGLCALSGRTLFGGILNRCRLMQTYYRFLFGVARLPSRALSRRGFLGRSALFDFRLTLTHAHRSSRLQSIVSPRIFGAKVSHTCYQSLFSIYNTPMIIIPFSACLCKGYPINIFHYFMSLNA